MNLKLIFMSYLVEFISILSLFIYTLCTKNDYYFFKEVLEKLEKYLIL